MKHSCEVCTDPHAVENSGERLSASHESPLVPHVNLTPPTKTKLWILRQTLPTATYSRSLEQCLAKPAGLRRQRESPEG